MQADVASAAVSIAVADADADAASGPGSVIHEHAALLRHLAAAQERCTRLVALQAAEIASLQARLLRQRAAVVLRETALAWEREDRARLEAAVPGLAARAALARRVEGLVARVQELMRERWLGSWRVGAAGERAAAVGGAGLGALERSLVAADLVICQTGCVSHGAYWRVQDHCKRTGKACVLVEQPDALRIVRIRAEDILDSGF